jgi:Zinc knuckle
MSSKIPSRIPPSSSSYPSIQAAIWPQGVKQTYVASLIQQFGGALSSANPSPSRSYAEVASVALAKGVLQSTATAGQISLAQLNSRIAFYFFHSRHQWIRDRCLRCGEKSHRAKICRNTRVCFNCGSLGHIFSRCSKSTPPSLHLVASISEPARFKKSSWAASTDSPSMTSSIAPSHSSLLHRIRLFDENSAKLAEEVHNSLLFRSEVEVPPFEILDGLRSVFPPSNMWKVHYLGLCLYQIQGPETWRREMAVIGSIVLKQRCFIVSSDLSCLYSQHKGFKL